MFLSLSLSIQEQRDTTNKIEYKALSANEFESCRELLNAFYGTKHFLNCCSYANCQDTAEEFTKLYRHHPKALESCIIALDARENVVCGCIRLSIDEIPRSNADNFLHVPEKDECYVSTVSCERRARGKGVGTRLLEEPKRSRGNIKKRDSGSGSSTEIQRNDCIVDSGLNPSKKQAPPGASRAASRACS